jgi:ABC-type nickel/cobalt efflux system permease component RcnA
MTTSWALAARGQLTDALRTHVAGTLLAFAALVAGLGATITAARGRRLAWQPAETTVAVLAVVLVGLILCEWIFRLLSQSVS